HLDHRGVPRPHEPVPLLMLGALGVVFGDIGTSPLYALQTVFSSHHNAVAPTESDVLGVISMVTWCLITIVTITYIGLIMTANNQGEGGILALTALVLRKLGPTVSPREAGIALVLGVLGAALFFGDSLITPAISVLSAFEGIEVTGAVPDAVILPAALLVLTALFAAQRWGTGRIGGSFGVVMALWFLTLAGMGLPHVLAHPSILRALSPTYAIAFMVDRPLVAFIAMGAVVLTITGAEALYADMGHFGHRPIALAWGCLVLPALLLNYFGQGALILTAPSAIANPFFSMVPETLRIPLVVLATMATVIASQAVIAGAFSVSRQAIRLNLLPKLKVTQTSSVHGGQIYVGTVNLLLFLGVVSLVLVFQRSSALAAAYGLAVTATIILVLALFLLYARQILHRPLWQVTLLAVIVGGLELLLLAATLIKIPDGGWLPLLIAAALSTIMLTWRRGAQLLAERRRAMEGPLADFVSGPARTAPRVAGLAVYPHPDPTTVPLALRTGVQMHHVLHQHVVILTLAHRGVPHVHRDDRVHVNVLGDASDGLVQITYEVGFHDSQDVPAALRAAVERHGRRGGDRSADSPAFIPELDLDLDEAIYVLSILRLEKAPGGGTAAQAGGMPRWQRALFRQLNRASAQRTLVLHLPPTRTLVMGAETEL
ncbi:MAG: KUP/HAK/KT family potassium transporter, partial [Brachybacterium sp.]|nr:KUP/HAK/KT family potassium transporter [Brachybacterium sp.]